MAMKDSGSLGQLADVAASSTITPAAHGQDATHTPVDSRPVAPHGHSRPVGPYGQFHAVFDTHYDFVCRTLYYAGVTAAAVEDAAQDVFLTLHRRLPECDGQRDLRNWLWGIARGVARTYRRSAARSQRKRAPAPAPQPSPLERVEQRERAAFVQRFLDTLGEGHRDVFTLMEIEGLSAPEVARLLELKLNTVYSRQRVARDRFKDALAKHRSEHEEDHHG